MAATLMQQMKKMDFYRHVPKDLTEPTAPGAIISIAASVIMVMLLGGELVSFFNPEIRTEMFVGKDASQSDGVKANFNISFYKFPCFAVSLDVVDVLGHRVIDAGGRAIHKTRLDRHGNTIGEWHHDESKYAEQAGAQEGCRVSGHVTLHKVPGMFRVCSCGKTYNELQHLPNGVPHVQHEIHSLYFGDVEFKGLHGYEGQVHPLNGQQNLDPKDTRYEYHLDIVPTTYTGRYDRKTGKPESGYQFTSTFHKEEVPPGHMPAVLFRHQMSPITVEVGPAPTSFLHFLTYVCAIVGGIFTVAGILSRSIHISAVQFQKRVLGKDA